MKKTINIYQLKRRYGDVRKHETLKKHSMNTVEILPLIEGIKEHSLLQFVRINGNFCVVNFLYNGLYFYHFLFVVTKKKIIFEINSILFGRGHVEELLLKSGCVPIVES